MGGLGYAFISSIMQYTGVLAAALSPATVLAPCNSDISFYAVSAMLTMNIGLLNISWAIILHRGLQERSEAGGFSAKAKIAAVIGGHYAVSFLTLATDDTQSNCASVLVPLYLVTLAYG